MPSSGWSAATDARKGSDQTITSVQSGRPFVDDLDDPEYPHGLLQLLDLHQGHRVLEIGYTQVRHTAELTARVGAQGHVMSVSGAGAARGRPYDRLVAWTALPALPVRWIENLAPGGVAVAVLPIAPLAAADAAVRVQLGVDGLPAVTLVVPDGFLALPDRVPSVPDRFVDATVMVGGQPWWVSAEWLHGRHEQDAVEVLAMLRDHQRCPPRPLAAEENARELVGYLLASRPDGMLTAGFNEGCAGIGCALPGSVAVLCGHQLVAGGTDEAAAGLLDWIEEWRSSGRPGLRAFRPYLQRKHTAWDLQFERS